MMSPGRSGARVRTPPFGPAEKVFWKNDSPPRKERPIDLRKPPVAAVYTVTPSSMLTIAPDYARICSLPDKVTTASA
jgi:hypothetical protein